MNRRSYGNVKCLRMTPTKDARKELVADYKTVGFHLNREQAIALATNLLNAARKSRDIDVTGFRHRDLITVTGTGAAIQN